MKAKVKYSLTVVEQEIDLEDYGFYKNTKFEDLTDKEKFELQDLLREDTIAVVSINTIVD